MNVKEPTWEVSTLTSDQALTIGSRGSFLTSHQYNAIKWSLVAIQMVVCLFGVVTNIINLAVFGKMGVAESAVSLTLFSLAVADLGFLVTYLIFLLFTASIPLGLDAGYQIFIISAWSLLYKISTAITVYLSLQKMFCVAIPFTFKNVFTVRRTAEVLLLTTVVVAGFYIPAFASFYVRGITAPLTNKTICALSPKPHYLQFREIQEISMDYVLPFSAQIIVIICLVVLVIKLSTASNFRRRNATTKTTKEESANSGASQLSIMFKSPYFSTSSIKVLCQLTKDLVYSNVLLYAIFLDPDCILPSATPVTL